ncbi:MAG: alpha/beta hydrolase [Myxococcota bacterium]
MLLLLACTGPRLLLDPDPTRDGLGGGDGPFGAAAVERRYTARVTDTVPTTVVYPADAAGQPVGEGHPVLVFVHGGFVAPDRYAWLWAHFASRGVVVAAPTSPLRLAITEPGNASAALDGLLADSGPQALWPGLVSTTTPAVVGGHSLGGVVSALVWADDDRFDGLFLAASFPADGTVARSGTHALALVGTEDGASPPADVQAGVAPLGAPVGLVDGLTHYGWTDGASARDEAGDGVATRPVDEARRDLLAVLDRWVDAVFAEDDATIAALPLEDHAGVTFGEAE